MFRAKNSPIDIIHQLNNRIDDRTNRNTNFSGDTGLGPASCPSSLIQIDSIRFSHTFKVSLCTHLYKEYYLYQEYYH